MENYEWIDSLKEIHSRFIFPKSCYDKGRLLTTDEQKELETIVYNGTNGYFSYIKNIYNYKGNIVQNKPMPWIDLYKIITRLPYACCERILLPYDEDLVSKKLKKAYPSHFSEMATQEYFPAEFRFNKNDNGSVIIYFNINYTKEDYDEDGYGGGITDYYILGLINNKGYWILPFIEVDDSTMFSLLNNGIARNCYDDNSYYAKIL